MYQNLIPLCLLIAFSVASNEFPQVQIEQGSLKGTYRNTWNGRKFLAFSGIPFAKPPVGELRFKAPVPAEPWNGVLDATKRHAMCPQMDVFLNDYTVKGDEDCLYLNVYTPQDISSSNELLPVMFYIHGGGWMCGDATPTFYGPDILLDKDVVLVTTNYRLGALGFLSTGDELVPGNNGLKDQNLALRWVKNNIIRFGGDPELITVFGQSAGGASTHYHTLSPLSKDLIQGAIAHSGTAFGTWAFAPKDQGVRNSKKLAQLLGCPTTNSKNMIDCLRKIDAYDIVEQDKKFYYWHYDPVIPFRPVVEPDIEGAFLSEDPIEIVKSGKSAKIPIIFGLTTEDGALKTAGIYNDSNLVHDLNKNFKKLAPILFMYDETASNPNQITKTLKQFYLGDKDIDKTTKTELTEMFTDGWFLLPADSAVYLHKKYTKYPVYYFLFGYKGSEGLGKLFGDPEHDYGVCHGDELTYLFSTEIFDDYKPNDSDKKMNEIMTTLWTNFAKTGDPTPETNSLIKTKWEPVKSSNLEYYFIKNEKQLEMSEKLYWERTKLWRNLPIDPRRKEVKDEL